MDPPFGSNQKARHHWEPRPFTVWFDHAITATGASASARIRVYRNGVEWKTITNSHPDVVIIANYVRVPLYYSNNATYTISIDEDFVKGSETHQTPSYFMGTRGNTLMFGVLPEGEISHSNYFTMALDGQMDHFTPERFCAGLGLIAWSIECSKIKYTIDDYYLPIVTFQFVDMSDTAAQVAEGRLLRAVSDGYLSVAMQSTVHGNVIPGSFITIVRDNYPNPNITQLLKNVSITLDVLNTDLPTQITVEAILTQDLPQNGKVEVILPLDFQVNPSDLTVELYNYTRTPFSYTVANGGITVGESSPNGIMVNTGTDPDIRAGETITLRITQGVKTPTTCQNMAAWVWVVKTFSTERLLDYSITNPHNDMCLGDRIRVGIPDPSEVVTLDWINAQPQQSIVHEQVKVQFFGFRHTQNPSAIYAKLAALYDGTCTGTAPGSTIVQLDAESSGSFTVVDEGYYDICIRHRDAWEPMAQKFSVRQQFGGPTSDTPAIFGYQSCEQMLQSKTDYCGCFYTNGVANPMPVVVPESIPLTDALDMTADVTILQGCCAASATQKMSWDVSPGVSPFQWGVCL